MCFVLAPCSCFFFSCAYVVHFCVLLLALYFAGGFVFAFFVCYFSCCCVSSCLFFFLLLSFAPSLGVVLAFLFVLVVGLCACSSFLPLFPR